MKRLPAPLIADVLKRGRRHNTADASFRWWLGKPAGYAILVGSKSFPTAVERNRIKRQWRAVVGREKFDKSMQLIIMPRRHATSEQMQHALKEVLGRALAVSSRHNV